MSDKKRKQESQVYPIFAKKAKEVDGAAAETSEIISSTEGDLSSSSSTEPKSLSLQEFADLLDFSLVDTEEEIIRRFHAIAKALLHGFRLVARREDGKEVEFEILESEFYLQVEGCHEDPFTHGSEEQRISGRWYFHRAPKRSDDSRRSLTSTTAYRGGSRKGMDLTFGGPSSQKFSKYFTPAEPSSSSWTSTAAPKFPARQLLRGGILLRSLRQLGPNSKVISGPSLLVDQILSVSGASNIEDLVQNKWEKNTSAFISEEDNPPTCLFLKPVESSGRRKAPVKIYFSPRIGLDLSHPGTTGPSTLPLHPRIRFLTKPYRFFIHPEQLVANGRCQTFLGVLQSCVSSSSSGLERPSLSGEIAELTGLRQTTVAKYLADYTSGRDAGVRLIESFIGPRGKGASSSPYTYLRMMGALSNLTDI